MFECIIKTRKGQTKVVANPNAYRMKQALREIRLSKDETIGLSIKKV